MPIFILAWTLLAGCAYCIYNQFIKITIYYFEPDTLSNCACKNARGIVLPHDYKNKRHREPSQSLYSTVYNVPFGRCNKTLSGAKQCSNKRNKTNRPQHAKQQNAQENAQSVNTQCAKTQSVSIISKQTNRYNYEKINTENEINQPARNPKRQNKHLQRKTPACTAVPVTYSTVSNRNRIIKNNRGIKGVIKMSELVFERIIIRGEPFYKITEMNHIRTQQELPTLYVDVDSEAFYMTSHNAICVQKSKNQKSYIFLNSNLTENELFEIVDTMKSAKYRLHAIEKDIQKLKKKHRGTLKIKI